MSFIKSLFGSKRVIPDIKPLPLIPATPTIEENKPALQTPIPAPLIVRRKKSVYDKLMDKITNAMADDLIKESIANKICRKAAKCSLDDLIMAEDEDIVRVDREVTSEIKNVFKNLRKFPLINKKDVEKHLIKLEKTLGSMRDSGAITPEEFNFFMSRVKKELEKLETVEVISEDEFRNISDRLIHKYENLD
jgi:hypothetical protein